MEEEAVANWSQLLIPLMILYHSRLADEPTGIISVVLVVLE